MGECWECVVFGCVPLWSSSGGGGPFRFDTHQHTSPTPKPPTHPTNRLKDFLKDVLFAPALAKTGTRHLSHSQDLLAYALILLPPLVVALVRCAGEGREEREMRRGRWARGARGGCACILMYVWYAASCVHLTHQTIKPRTPKQNSQKQPRHFLLRAGQRRRLRHRLPLRCVRFRNLGVISVYARACVGRLAGCVVR